MSDTERVVMVWPKSLKDSVRTVAGPRGITEFVIMAVQKALAVPYVEDPEEDETVDSENRQSFETANPVVPERGTVSEELKVQPIVIKTKKTQAPEPLPHDVRDRDDLFARLMARTGGDVDADALKRTLRPASEIAKPVPKVDACATCGEELVNGECWTCS